VRSLLQLASQNEVVELSPDVFQRHATAGALFSAETAEII
jgi:hypothetical protein